MARLRLRLAIPALASVALAIGCGSGEESTGDTAPPDFVATVDSICIDSAREQYELYLETRPEETLETTAVYMRGLRDAGGRALAELEAVVPEAEMKEDWDAYLANRQASLDTLAERERAAEQGDSPLVRRTAQELAAQLEERDEIGRRLGLGACGRKLSPAAEEEVREVVEVSSTTDDHLRICEELVASTYLEQEFGGSVDRCVRAQSRGVPAEAVEFDSVVGVEGVVATASGRVMPAQGPELDVLVELAYEDGAYRLYNVISQSAG